MIVALRIVFLVFLAAILSATTWASLRCPLFGVPREVATHPWFIATLVDAYLGFLTFFVWVAWRETKWLSRVAWFVAILALGNVAMASYCLERLFSVKADTPFPQLLGERRGQTSWLGLLLAVGGVLTWYSLG